MTTIKLSKATEATVESLDMTPSFEEATRMLCIVLMHGSPQGQREAQEELCRYARELDRLAAMTGSTFDPIDTAIEG